MNEQLDMRDLDACSHDEFVDDLEALVELKRPLADQGRKALVRDVLTTEIDENDREQADFVLTMADAILATQLGSVLRYE
jgi:uncharacterized protein YfeS